MFVEVVDNFLKIIGDKPIELNLNIEPYFEDEPLFETIKIKDGKVYNLEYHQKRVDKSYKYYYKTKPKLRLEKVLINLPKSGLYRAKVIYNKYGLVSKGYYTYSKKVVKKLALVEISNINYHFKFLKRDLFNIPNQIADDFLITKNGYITDTTIANIAFLYNNQWITPSTPLLKGTTRERYLKLKKLTTSKIHYKNLKNYSKIALLNAMIDFDILN